MLSKFDKAWAAILVSFITSALTHFTGWTIGPELSVGLTTALTGFFVFLIPNKKP